MDAGGSGRSVGKTSSSRRARVTATLRRRWPPSLLVRGYLGGDAAVLVRTDGHREDDDVPFVALHILDVLDQLVVTARRFRCDVVLCGRQIFTERFAEGVLAPSARRTTRLDCIVPSSRAGARRTTGSRLRKTADVLVSKDTLLRGHPQQRMHPKRWLILDLCHQRRADNDETSNQVSVFVTPQLCESPTLTEPWPLPLAKMASILVVAREQL